MEFVRGVVVVIVILPAYDLATSRRIEDVLPIRWLFRTEGAGAG
jgi:hypothetical protein